MCNVDNVYLVSSNLDTLCPRNRFSWATPRCRMSLFSQELALLIFGKDVLTSSSLTGKSGPTGAPKDQLDLEMMGAHVGTYWLIFCFVFPIYFSVFMMKNRFKTLQGLLVPNDISDAWTPITVAKISKGQTMHGVINEHCHFVKHFLYLTV